jgi:hypothetical protein
LRVIVAPITTRKFDAAQTVELPPRLARHLGLQPGCRVVCNDLNRFTWVGPDIRARPNGSPFYGQVPARLFDDVRARVLANAMRPTRRSE